MTAARTYDISHEIDAELLMEGALATGDSEEDAKWGVEHALESFVDEHRGKVALVTYRSDGKGVFETEGQRVTVGGRIGGATLPTSGVNVRRNRRDHNCKHIPFERVLSIYVFTDEDLRAAYAPETAVHVFKYASDYYGIVKEQKRTRVLVEFRTLGGKDKEQWFSMNSVEMWPANGFAKSASV